MPRKSPYEHSVSGHFRSGKYVNSYRRGTGTRQISYNNSRRRPHVVVKADVDIKKEVDIDINQDKPKLPTEPVEESVEEEMDEIIELPEEEQERTIDLGDAEITVYGDLDEDGQQALDLWIEIHRIELEIVEGERTFNYDNAIRVLSNVSDFINQKRHLYETDLDLNWAYRQVDTGIVNKDVEEIAIGLSAFKKELENMYKEKWTINGSDLVKNDANKQGEVDLFYRKIMKQREVYPDSHSGFYEMHFKDSMRETYDKYKKYPSDRIIKEVKDKHLMNTPGEVGGMSPEEKEKATQKKVDEFFKRDFKNVWKTGGDFDSTIYDSTQKTYDKYGLWPSDEAVTQLKETSQREMS